MRSGERFSDHKPIVYINSSENIYGAGGGGYEAPVKITYTSAELLFEFRATFENKYRIDTEQ